MAESPLSLPLLLHNSSSVSAREDLTEHGIWSRHCAAGGISAAASKIVTAPLDRIKMHMQVTDCNSGGFLATVRHVYNCHGVHGFWRGNGLSVLKSSPEFAIKFSVYDYVKRQLMTRRDDGHLKGRDRFVAGAFAGVCGQTFLYPLETVKTRFTVGKYADLADAVVKTYKTGGPLAFFKGFWPSTLSIFIFTGIDLMIYEHVKCWQSDRQASADHSKWSINLVSALCSSTVGVTVCYPISTIITRLQVNDGCSELFPCSVTMLVQDGRNRLASWTNVRRLYRGYSSSFFKMLPTMTISYVVYEELCKSFGVQMS